MRQQCQDTHRDKTGQLPDKCGATPRGAWRKIRSESDCPHAPHDPKSNSGGGPFDLTSCGHTNPTMGGATPNAYA